VLIAPHTEERFAEAVIAGGGQPASDLDHADAIIWTDPGNPEGLAGCLDDRPAISWVQLPFAGIESFFDSGAIRSGPSWTCAKGIYGPATAEHAFTLILSSARLIHRHARAKTWRNRGGFGAPERRLKGSTVLVVGTGGIGSALVPMLLPLGPRVVAVNRSGRELAGADRTVAMPQLEGVIGEADFVVLAAPLTPETRGLFDKRMLYRMKSDAWLINVARGGLVVTEDLVGAVQERAIGGAALDVTDPEPLPDDHPLWARDNVLITPHVANTWDMAVPELIALVTRNVRSFGRGAPLEGIVDIDAGY
jgi:D-3-phosphoglycerate dehydrogenase